MKARSVVDPADESKKKQKKNKQFFVKLLFFVIFRGPDSFEHSVCRSDVMTRFRPQVHLQKMILMVPPTISENLAVEFPNTLYINFIKYKILQEISLSSIIESN